MTKTILYAIAAALIAVTTLVVAAPTQQPELAGRGGGAAPHSGPRVYRFDQTILVGASERSFTLNLPPTYYDSSARVPLVIALHGGGGSGAQFEKRHPASRKKPTLHGWPWCIPTARPARSAFGAGTAAAVAATPSPPTSTTSGSSAS